LVKFDGKNWTIFKYSSSDWPNSQADVMAIDEIGNIWIGSHGAGLLKFDGTNWNKYDMSNSGLFSNIITSIAIDRDGSKWMGTEGGMTKFDDIHWTTYCPANSALPASYVSNITIDKNGNKWFAVVPGGLAVFKEGGIAAVKKIVDENCGPENFVLKQNFPNPFNPETEISYKIPVPQTVTLSIFDMTGRLVRTLVHERKNSGHHSIRWNGRDNDGNIVSSGVYLYRIKTEEFCMTRKAILVR
jgi:hypothetical protein